MKVSLKNITPNAEINVVEIARVSSNRQDKSEAPEGLINYLIKNKHWSPFQHSCMTVEIVTSKAIAIQYLRHLSFTFQEFSQRYAVVENIEPIEFRLKADKNRQSSTDVIGSVIHRPEISANAFETIVIDEYVNSNTGNQMPEIFNKYFGKVAKNLNDTLELYKEGLELGIAKETARMILPMASQTTLYMTGSLRSWIHLIDLRTDSHAQKEAQLIALEIKKIFIEQCPIISKSLNYEVSW